MDCKVKVTIEGAAASGKSFLVHAMRELLEPHGFTIEDRVSENQNTEILDLSFYAPDVARSLYGQPKRQTLGEMEAENPDIFKNPE